MCTLPPRCPRKMCFRMVFPAGFVAAPVLELMGLDSLIAHSRASVAAAPPPWPPRVHACSETAGGENRGQQLDSDLQAHPSPHIGPDTHCLIPDEVEQVHRLRDEERADGSNASLATQMEHR